MKVFYGNCGTYISMANFVMLLATFKATYNLPISAWIIAPLGLILIFLIGYLDYKLIFKQQFNIINKKNDIKFQLNEIEKKLNIILEKK